MVIHRRIIGGSAAAIITSLLITSCQAQPSKYDTYAKAVRSDHYNANGTPIEPLDKGDADALADMICAKDYTRTDRALAVLDALQGKTLAPYQAGRIGKAYCDDWTGAFATLALAVAHRYGGAAVYEIPQ